MAEIEQVLARVFVDSLDDALPFYEDLSGVTSPRRFGFGEVELAWVGPFLLLSGPADELDRYRDRVASVIVADVEEVARQVVAGGGKLIDGPAEGPNGARLIARHPDGAVFEYLQITASDETV